MKSRFYLLYIISLSGLIIGIDYYHFNNLWASLFGVFTFNLIAFTFAFITNKGMESIDKNYPKKESGVTREEALEIFWTQYEAYAIRQFRKNGYHYNTQDLDSAVVRTIVEVQKLEEKRK